MLSSQVSPERAFSMSDFEVECFFKPLHEREREREREREPIEWKECNKKCSRVRMD